MATKHTTSELSSKVWFVINNDLTLTYTIKRGEVQTTVKMTAPEAHTLGLTVDILLNRQEDTPELPNTKTNPFVSAVRASTDQTGNAVILSAGLDNGDVIHRALTAREATGFVHCINSVLAEIWIEKFGLEAT